MYAIIRTKRLKDGQKINKCFAHNLRTITQANIDSTKTHKNKILVNNLNIDNKKATDFRKKLMKFYDDLGIKIRTNNVLAREFVATASPEFFKGKTPEQIDEWAKHQVDFMQAEFGEQMRFAILHMDEATPHLHFVITSEQKSVKRYKNRYGAGVKETWSLNSNWINQTFLREFQTRFAEHNASYGLKRGQRGSKRRHIAPLEYNNRLERRLKVLNKQNETQERLNKEARQKRYEARRERDEAREKNRLAHTIGGAIGEVMAKARDAINGLSPEALAKIEEAERLVKEEQEKRKKLESQLEKEKESHNRELQELFKQRERLQNEVQSYSQDLKLSEKVADELRSRLEKYEPLEEQKTIKKHYSS